jgi:pimeloyl-ACP methyl ester carboxylesterase
MKIELDGATIFFDVEGPAVVASAEGWVERPTVVLLHPGPGADHSVYKDIIGPRLAEVAQVVYVDLRGEGRSTTGDPSTWNVPTWADDVAALLGALEIRSPVLYGTSVGALVALRLAATRPELVGRLVLASAVARVVHARSVATFDRIAGPAVGEVAARYYADPNELTLTEFLRVCRPHLTREWGVDPDVLARMQLNADSIVHWDGVECRGVDATGDAARVQCPVLLVAGTDDPVSPLASVQELAEALPQDRLSFTEYPGAGHGVVRDAPHALDEILGFVRGAPSGDGATIGPW